MNTFGALPERFLPEDSQFALQLLGAPAGLPPRGPTITIAGRPARGSVNNPSSHSWSPRGTGPY